LRVEIEKAAELWLGVVVEYCYSLSFKSGLFNLQYCSLFLNFERQSVTILLNWLRAWLRTGWLHHN